MTLVNIVPQVVLHQKMHLLETDNFLGESNRLPAPSEAFLSEKNGLGHPVDFKYHIEIEQQILVNLCKYLLDSCPKAMKTKMAKKDTKVFIL